jgi:hypothetical protein
MTRFLAASMLIAAGAVVGSHDLLACGDKFLVVSRGTRFQRAAPLRDAAILLYARPSSVLPQLLSTVPVDAALKKAGYRPTTVATADDLDKAVARGGWNLVVADVADMPALQPRLRGVAALAVLPPDKASSADLKNAKRENVCVLKSPTRTQAFLDAIDEALATRPASTATGKTN